MKRGLLLALIGLALMIASALPVNAASVSVYDCCGGLTASGRAFNPYSEFTAAHYSYPFGTMLRICREDGVTCVNTEVTDRSPSPDYFDVSWVAGTALGLTDGVGRCQCSVEVLYMPSA